MFRAKILIWHMLHIEGWRLAWALVLLVGLLGWELLQGIERQSQATALTLLFKPGFAESDIRVFLKTLPAPWDSSFREPAQLQADSRHLLEKLGHSPSEAWPEEEGLGWALELHWRGLSPELEKQLRWRVEQSAWVEEAYWASPLSHAAWARLHRALWLLFALGTGASLLLLSLCCLRAEARQLRVLVALGASFPQLRRLWLAQSFLWAALGGAAAYALWKLALQAFSAQDMSPSLGRFVTLGTACGGAGALLAWALRGKACCT